MLIRSLEQSPLNACASLFLAYRGGTACPGKRYLPSRVENTDEWLGPRREWRSTGSTPLGNDHRGGFVGIRTVAASPKKEYEEMTIEEKSNQRHGLRIAGLGAALAVAVGLLATGVASADTFIPLPDGSKEGPNATVTRTGESALVSQSLAANGAGRVAWVSGTVTVDVRGIPEVTDVPVANGAPSSTAGINNGTNASTTHGVSRVSTGYIVGCQVDVTGLSASPSFSADSSSISPSLGLTVPLNSGEIKYVPVTAKDIPKDGVYAVQYQNAELQVQKCGGFAQARAYTVVEIVGNDYSKTVMYGAPFSIG